MKFDPSDLTLGELEELEEVSGEAAGELFSGTWSPKMVRGIAWLMKRRQDPSYQFEATKALTMGELVTLIEGKKKTKNRPMRAV